METKTRNKQSYRTRIACGGCRQPPLRGHPQDGDTHIRSRTSIVSAGSKRTHDIHYNNNEEDHIQKLSDKLSALANFTSTQIKVIYDDELEKLPVSFRRFTSLNINNTKQNIFYKVVESSTDYQIDKLVYYRNGLIYNGNDKLSKPTNIYNLIFDGFDKDTKTKSRLLAEYLYKTS